MAWRYHSRARVDARKPAAWGVCDRCSFTYQLREGPDHLRWQYEWNGSNRLYNKRILVCPHCLDKPQPQLKSRVLPPDPLPVPNARPGNVQQQMASGPAPIPNPLPRPPSPSGDFLLTESGQEITTETGVPIQIETTGPQHIQTQSGQDLDTEASIPLTVEE